MDRDIAGVGAPDGVLHFPFETVPDNGTATEILPGIVWVRLHLPFSLAHINVWLLEDGDGWALIDTGCGIPQTQKIWGEFGDTVLKGKPITRIFVTHHHPDHIGNAGFLARFYGAPVHTSRTEYLICRMILDERAGDEPPGELLEWMDRVGYPDHLREIVKKEGRGGFRKLCSPLPLSYRRLQDGDRLEIGGRSFEVLVGRGHAPEHACLYCADEPLIFSGDQILPFISSNVSVTMMEPESNPLDDWITSCEMLIDRLDPKTLVLPAHREPFVGAQIRLNDLIAGHVEGLEVLRTECRTPRRAVDLFEALFGRKIGDDHFGLAAGECVAHLNYLVQRGEMARSLGKDGAWQYQTL
mgnify:CR=1 FL=1